MDFKKWGIPKHLWKKPQQAMLGIDIGTTSVKLVELSQNDDTLTLETYAIEPMPADVVVEKEIKDVDQVGQAIARAYEKSRATLKGGAVALPGAAIITKLIEVSSQLKEADIVYQVTQDADRYIPYPSEEVSLDFEVLGPSAKNSDMLDVLLVASRTDQVDLRVDALAVAGLQTRVVDVEPYAIERAFQFQKRDPQDKRVGLVDFGGTNLSLSVLNDNQMIYTREQAFGSKKLVEEIQLRYGLSYAEAVRWYKSEKMPDDLDAELLTPYREAAAQQVQRALQLFFSSTEHRTLDHLYVTGGVVGMHHLIEALQETLQLKVDSVNPFASMALGKKINPQVLKDEASSLLVACGLALRGFHHADH